MNTLIDWIESQMMTDDEDRAKQSSKLRDLYETATAEQREILDDALICICGYSLKSALSSLADDH
jgi:hypothetical protein